MARNSKTYLSEVYIPFRSTRRSIQRSTKSSARLRILICSKNRGYYGKVSLVYAETDRVCDDLRFWLGDHVNKSTRLFIYFSRDIITFNEKITSYGYVRYIVEYYNAASVKSSISSISEL